MIQAAGWCRLGRAAFALAVLALASFARAEVKSYTAPAAGGDQAVDTALVVSVDVSGSVDERRYQLQMEGIAKALEDPAVLDALLNGPQAGILFTMVTFADHPQMAVPWMRIASREDAFAAAAKVRAVPKQGGDFTCVGAMLRFVSDKVVTQIPASASRIVVDVSGDGSDNCNPAEPIGSVKQELVSGGVTINGLPILEGREAETLEAWYRENVMGGTGSFVLPAKGYADFGRAIRQKFVVEVSDAGPGSRLFAERAVEVYGLVEIERGPFKR